MVKFLLYGIILASCGGLGILKAQKFAERLEDLEDLKQMALILETEMSYKKDPLPGVFQRISTYKENRAMDLLATCAEELQANRPFHHSWQKSLSKIYAHSNLTAEDRHILKDLGLQLGKSDIQGQAAMFALFKNKLNHQVQEAAQEAKTKGKMCKSLGFAIGAVAVIILL